MCVLVIAKRRKLTGVGVIFDDLTKKAPRY